MQFSPMQYKFIKPLLDQKINELRAAWKASKDEEQTNELGNQLAIAQRAAETIELLYLNQ